MENLNNKNIGFYDWIKKIKNEEKKSCYKVTSQASLTSQSALTTCNYLGKNVTHHVTGASQERNMNTNNLESHLMNIYGTEIEKINSIYQVGGLEYIEKHYPGLHVALQRAEDELNQAWDKCLDGSSKAEDFQKALNKWLNLQGQGIEYFKKQMAIKQSGKGGEI